MSLVQAPGDFALQISMTFSEQLLGEVEIFKTGG